MSRYQRLMAEISRRFLLVARHPYALIIFLLFAITDSVLLVLPAEMMAVTLMIFQPHRVWIIGIWFALAAAVSAWILSTLVSGATDIALSSSPELSEMIGTGSTLVADWGAPVMAALAIFPDSPRASITAATVAGLSPVVIALSVLAGKLVLYALIVYLVSNLPRFTDYLRNSRLPFAAILKPRLRRFAAFQRLINRRAG